MLRATSRVAPRGVYVCGNTASASGLTVTMIREGKYERMYVPICMCAAVNLYGFSIHQA